jgi:predicted DNA-binding transcriptional regulator
MLIDSLRHLGFSDSEADIYLTCLKLGTQELSFIAREAKLPSAEVKTLLRSLLNQGFVSRYISGNREFFTAESPSVLLRITEQHKGTNDPAVDFFRSALPELEAFMKPGQARPDIAFYEGDKALIAAYEDTLTSTTEIVAVASIDDTEATLGSYVRTYYRRRKAAGIPIRAIFPDTPMSRKRQMLDAQELRESRLLPASLMHVQLEWNVYNNTVAFFSCAEKVAVLIRSKLIADAMRASFEVQWEMARLLQEKNKKR